MQFSVVAVLTFVTYIAQAEIDVTQLTHVQPHLPVNPKHTWAEWMEIMANQEVVADPNAVYPGTEPQPEDAGVAPPLPNDSAARVIGGSAASQGQFPWQAAISLDGSSFCGGSLISPTFVLTAAHCTAGVSSFQVTLGASNIQTSQSGVVRQVTRSKIQHSGYNPSTINNDISVLRLSTAVSQSSVIRTVRLPRQSQASNTFQGSTVIVSGFGKTSSNSGISATLRYASLSVISNTNCASYFGSAINSFKICTSGANGRTPCNGDSGGPLVISEGGQYTQVGLVSFGSNGCLTTWPAVFTRITSYLSWISSNTGIAIQP